MRERAELSGGAYAVTSAIGRGTKVRVAWPAKQALIARNSAFGASEIADRPFLIQREPENEGKSGKNGASAELDEVSLRPGWKEAYRAQPDTLAPAEMDAGLRPCAPP
jgi:hypothetical protein